MSEYFSVNITFLSYILSYEPCELGMILKNEETKNPDKNNSILDDKVSYIHESIIFLCVYVQFCMSYNKVKFARQKIFI